MKRAFGFVGAIILPLLIYLLMWPVPIDPQPWEAPANPGYVGVFEPNNALAGLQRIDIGAYTGPEDAAFGPDGKLYLATHEGAVLATDPATGETRLFAETGGRPLGIEFSKSGELFVADAYLGLMKINTDGSTEVLANETSDGSPILYADDLDIAADGTVYFSDASTKFGAKEHGGTLPASLLDLMEHGGHGRILKYDPENQATTVLADGLTFANGIALTADGRYLLAVETGTYAVIRYDLEKPAGTPGEKIVENLPGFPDNINRNPDGTFWLGLVSPRSAAADAMSGNPFLRKVTMRLPEFMRPQPQRYGFVIKINEEGQILETKQDPTGAYALTTGAIEAPDGSLFVTSLTEPDLGVVRP